MSTQRVSVWAPKLDSLAVRIGSDDLQMQRGEQGWFTLQEELPHGTDYWLVLGDRTIPDPASRYQPQGITGPTRAWSHETYQWDADPPELDLTSGPIYELHVGTFSEGGTFASTIENLDHLVDLGVSAVELMPVAEFSGKRGWGYDGVLLYAPHHAYGTPDDLKRLVDECHRRGLGIILDVVYNHLGPVGNHLAELGPYFTSRYETPWGEAVNLDAAGSDEVRSFFIDNALMWLRDYRFDGLRLDAVHAIFDQSAMHFLEEMRAKVDDLSAESSTKHWLIAESDLNDPRLIHPTDRGGYGLDAQWSDDFHHAVHAVVTGEQDGYYSDFGSLTDVGKAITRGYVFTGQHSKFRERKHGRDPQWVDGSHFVVCSQNHDQVGNRAFGERLQHLTGIDQAKVAAALVLLSPHIPLLFQGEEWAASSPFLYFTDHEDQQLGEQVKQGRREEFASFEWDDEVPDPQALETFERSMLRWQEMATAPHDAVLEWYRNLIALRRREPDLRNPDLSQLEVVCEDNRWMTMKRGSFLCCFALQESSIPVEDAERVVLSSGQCQLEKGTLVMAAMTAAVLAL